MTAHNDTVDERVIYWTPPSERSWEYAPVDAMAGVRATDGVAGVHVGGGPGDEGALWIDFEAGVPADRADEIAEQARERLERGT